MLFSVLTSSAVGLVGLLIAAPAHVNALVTPGSGSELGHLAARRLAGVSPNHHALARRKTNAHKKRQRCQQRPVSPTSTPAPQPTGTPNNVGADLYVGGGDNNNNNNTPSNPTTTTTPNTGTYTPPPVPAAGNGKLILAWPNDNEAHVSDFFTGKASYYYNWRPTRTGGDPGNLIFCPMLWGDGNDKIDPFVSTVVEGYSTCVLAFNEVNQHDQGMMSVDRGAELWNNFIAPLSNHGYTILGSPSTTSAPDGLTWMMEWLPKVAVKPNVICVHWYDVGFDKFKAYVENYHSNTGGINVWVTEFACQNFNGGGQCTADDIWYFVHQAVAWMDATPWITGYAPFGFMRDMVNVNYLNQLMDPVSGYPNALGSYFIKGY